VAINTDEWPAFILPPRPRCELGINAKIAECRAFGWTSRLQRSIAGAANKELQAPS
jgi:hypothetical protein